ncbi:helix-turn-helix domain-containing protein [Nitrosomonas sp. Nm58]|uniref:helix-turn-helix domain-containing protein n=1 Tax=Nitrosomonas sp. Nm58 TaxID=200126 RepID=UPI000895259F|nr:helix-turn-helix domain-containing protein [Nitrosomonas sp. Nm58]SDY37803.1 DNA-binding transcriptional regulator YdaS, prophage-encoded, Cro superfamily [Nitrosomonas sp. Nm58]
MRTNIQITAIKKACQIVGGQAQMALLLKVTIATINQWTTGHRPIPAAHCPNIERLTDGKVVCEELHPNIDWAYIRGRVVPKKTGTHSS